MIKLRIQGLPDDIAEFARFLEEHPDITVYETSQPYANRGTSHYVRAYAEIELDHDAVKNVILTKINERVRHEPDYAAQRAL